MIPVKKKTLWQGKLISINLNDVGELEVLPTQALKANRDHRKHCTNTPAIAAWGYLLADHFENGWSLVSPVELGWLVSETMPILQYGEDPRKIWYFELYATVDEIGLLLKGHTVVFRHFVPGC